MKIKSLFASFSSEKEEFSFGRGRRRDGWRFEAGQDFYCAGHPERASYGSFGFRLLLLMALLMPGVAGAEVVTPPVISPPDTWVQRNAGTLRVLNKLDSTVQTLTLHVGDTTHLQSLTITLEACAVRPDDLPADATAHLKVVDSRADQPGYDGWILEKEPAINIFEHPVYDIQLVSCS